MLTCPQTFDLSQQGKVFFGFSFFFYKFMDRGEQGVDRPPLSGSGIYWRKNGFQNWPKPWKLIYLFLMLEKSHFTVHLAISLSKPTRQSLLFSFPSLQTKLFIFRTFIVWKMVFNVSYPCIKAGYGGHRGPWNGG